MSNPKGICLKCRKDKVIYDGYCLDCLPEEIRENVKKQEAKSLILSRAYANLKVWRERK